MGGYRCSDTARPATGSVPSTHGSRPGQPPRLDDTSRQLSAHPPRAPPRRHCATDTPHLRRWRAPPLAATRRSVGTWGRSRRQRPLVIHPHPIGWTSGGRTAATGGRGLSPTRVWLPRRRGLGGGWGAAPSATGPAAQICNRRGGGGGAAELAAWLVWGAADEPPGGAAPPAPTRAPLGARARRRPQDSHQQPKREGVEQRHTIGQSFKILAHHWPRLLCFAPRGLLRQKNWATPWITKRARLSAARAQSGGAKSGCEATVGRLSLARGALCLPPPPSPHRRGSAYRLEPPLPARARRWWSRG